MQLRIDKHGQHGSTFGRGGDKCNCQAGFQIDETYTFKITTNVYVSCISSMADGQGRGVLVRPGQNYKVHPKNFGSRN
jgi:hypothetical protein